MGRSTAQLHGAYLLVARPYFRFTSSPSSVRVCTSGKMAMFYTRCLQDLPKLSISDVHRLVRKGCSVPRSKWEKGYKMYLSSFIDNYEGKFEIDSKTHSHCGTAN